VKTMAALRLFAIASNIAFIGYGYLGHMHPILLLHAGLLPLNVWRLWQTRRCGEARRAGSGARLSGKLLRVRSRRWRRARRKPGADPTTSHRLCALGPPPACAVVDPIYSASGFRAASTVSARRPASSARWWNLAV
jgi:hypothetical protein